MLTLIVARAQNGAIGRGNTIPWSAPEDLAFFQRETLGGALIMGRNTWESLPKRPLPRRLNIVVTSRPLHEEGALVASLTTARDMAEAAGYARVYAIGGAGIYGAFLPQADRLLITEVDLTIADANTFFPPVALETWRKTAQIELRSAAPSCRLCEYLRK
ncbi:MAG: dihydrofolate reductase FolA [Roseibaca calidilacus]|uniref:Dihydrofolate reductase n=1 Tax=Roseibaca calidilacus TaxID=1666912 RepID=A0A0P7W4M4_9RHOB|nr:dihydrofolate reductase [Roseibaca calidilacus]KPP91575.1 MAG: dihydrofolate reductase FolA [Roseibaca calidilacus]CUX82889.1 dihydrofolate reductase [Roseibaca calidilacus]